MTMDPETLRTIYRRQYRWFAGQRNRLLRKADIAAARNVLDLGCGTGEVLRDLAGRVRGMAVGLGSGRLFFTEPGLGRWVWQGVGALICVAAAIAVERLLSRGLNRLAGPPMATYEDS